MEREPTNLDVFDYIHEQNIKFGKTKKKENKKKILL